MSNQVEEIIKHIEEIENQVDNISTTSYVENQILTRALGPNHGDIHSFNLSSDIQTEEDFYCAVYTLIGLLSLNKNYSELLNIHTKEICTIIEGQVEQETINNIYSNIAGYFFIEDPEYDTSLYSNTCLVCNTSSDRFNAIFKDKYYEPNGTGYLQHLHGLLHDYFAASDTIPGYLETLKKALLQL